MPNAKKRPIGVKEMLCDALCQLLAEGKEYSQISIQNIVDRAGTCRNSFYRNYRSKDDILKERYQQITAADEVPRPAQLDLFGIAYQSCLTCKQNKEFFLCFYKANTLMYLETTIQKILTSNTKKATQDLPLTDYYLYLARAWMATGIITQWMLRGCDAPVEDIARFIEKSLP